MPKGSRVVYITVVLLWSMLAHAQEASVLFVVDGSGSMWGKVKDQPKMAVAQAVMSDLLLNLDPAVRAGLMVYGHNRKDDCADIEVVAPLGSERGAMVETLKGIQPKGKTPLTQAIRLAAAQFREYEGSASVVLVSDGKETCEGDPCAAASEASAAGVNLRIHVIGFDVTPEETAQLTCVADKGKGKYFAAADAGQLKVALEEVKKEVAAPPPPAPPPEPKPPTDEVLFEDQFERDELGESYEVVDPDPNRLAVSDGKVLIVATEPAKNWVYLQQTFPGNFTATVKVTTQVTNNNVVTLRYRLDDENRLVLGIFGQQRSAFETTMGRHIFFSKVLNGAPNDIWGIYEDSDLPRLGSLGNRDLKGYASTPEAWYLQTERSGFKYTGRVSVDGVKWTDIGTHTLLQKDGRLGFGAGSGGGVENAAEFDDFVVKGAK